MNTTNSDSGLLCGASAVLVKVSTLRKRKSRGFETVKEVAEDQIMKGLWKCTLLVMGSLGDILGKRVA